MSAETDSEPGTGPDGPAAARDTYRDNEQRLGQGAQVLGNVAGNVTVVTTPDAVTDFLPPPRLREGPYPAADVHGRLRGFVEPPTHARCREVLDSRVLILRAGAGTGASTAAFALLAERYGAGGVIGLDSSEDLSRWRPTEKRGYLLQGLSPSAANALSEVVLTALASLLLRTESHLLVTVRGEIALPADTGAWQVTHCPPPSVDIASNRLRAMTVTGHLTAAQSADAHAQLTSADFATYLRAHRLPRDGVDVATGLRDLVVSGKPAAFVLEDLRTGTPAAARTALRKAAAHSADSLALMSAISLLPQQDRTVLEQFTALLRPRLEERGGSTTAASGAPVQGSAYGPHDPSGENGAHPQRRDLLGPSFEERLEKVGAYPLPPSPKSAQRFPLQTVAFSGQHRSETLLRSLWLDYEGMADLLWATLYEVRHQSELELAAGQAIGKVLAHATGPSPLSQFSLFANSKDRWQRRLVAYALGELAQYPALTSSVRAQLRRWSRLAPVTVRCTVAETCAGSFGLARPTVALSLLESLLDRPDGELDSTLRAAVSFALSALLYEDRNHALVLDRVLAWQRAGAGTQRHAMAVHVVESMSLATFPRPGAPGARRIRLSELIAHHPERAFDLVTAALDAPATHAAVATGLATIERDPGLRHQTSFPHFLSALSGAARTNRGVLRFVLRRHRLRDTSLTEGFAS
ncbi:hypothetical protein [Streptomyces sp. NPDC054784]